MSFKWKAIIKTQWGDVNVEVDAPNQHVARKIIESKYGRGNIIGNEVRQS